MTDTADWRVVKLSADTALPCAVWRDGALCGRPALVAHATLAHAERWEWKSPGLWLLQPVCKECAAAMTRVYERGTE